MRTEKRNTGNEGPEFRLQFSFHTFIATSLGFEFSPPHSTQTTVHSFPGLLIQEKKRVMCTMIIFQPRDHWFRNE